MPPIKGSSDISGSRLGPLSTAGKVRFAAFALVVLSIIATNLVMTPTYLLVSPATGWFQEMGIHQVHDMTVAALIWLAFIVPMALLLYHPTDRVNTVLTPLVVAVSIAVMAFLAGSFLFEGFLIGSVLALTALAHPERVGPIALLGTPATFPGENVAVPQRLASLPVISGLLFENVVRPDDTADVREGWERNGHPEETTTSLPEADAEATYRMDNLPYVTLSSTSLVQSVTGFWGRRPGPSLTPDDLNQVRSPVQLLWGSTDPFGSVETGRAGAEQFRDAEFHEVGVGHLPWLDAPAACGEAIRGSLGERA